jgi:hypothetical protein
MEIEHLFRSTALAVGLKPSAMECKARLRGLYRIISSKTISPPITADYDSSPQGLHDVRQGFSPPITADHDPSPQGLHDVWQGFSPPITSIHR